MNLENDESEEVSLETLPSELLSKIIGYLPYEKIANVRQVSQRFNLQSMSLLNVGFQKFGEEITRKRVETKKALPRRESLRRNHPGFNLSEVYSSMETRFELLTITYKRYIENNTFCFIPGKVLDEGFRVLFHLKETTQDGTFNGNIGRLLKDLRDLSSMAMDYFEEQMRQFQPHFPFLYGSIFTTQAPNAAIVCNCGSSTSSYSQQEEESELSKQRDKIAELEQIVQKQNDKIETLYNYCTKIGSVLKLDKISLETTDKEASTSKTKPRETKRKRDESEESIAHKRTRRTCCVMKNGEFEEKMIKSYQKSKEQLNDFQ